MQRRNLCIRKASTPPGLNYVERPTVITRLTDNCSTQMVQPTETHPSDNMASPCTTLRDPTTPPPPPPPVPPGFACQWVLPNEDERSHDYGQRTGDQDSPPNEIGRDCGHECGDQGGLWSHIVGTHILSQASSPYICEWRHERSGQPCGEELADVKEMVPHVQEHVGVCIEDRRV